MTRRTRTLLFSFFIILFILITPLTVLYSLGWRIDWKSKKIIQTGAFYFKVWPKNCRVYLNEELEKKTDFFFGSALIENLLPKKYNVEIKKEGFQSWRKSLKIKERTATEAKNIILIPEKPNFTLTAKNVEKFFFSPDEKKVILLETENDSETPTWSLKLFELGKNIKSHLIKEEDISLARRSLGEGGKKEKNELFDLKFSPDSGTILLEIEAPKKINYYILEINKDPLSLIPLDFLNSEVDKIIFYPKNHQRLLILKEGMLSEVDLATKKISPPLLEEIITLLPLNNNVYYLDTSGFIYKTDFSFKNHEKLNQVSFPAKEEAQYQISAINQASHFFLKENNILYVFNRNEKNFKKIFEPVKNLSFSPDSQKMVYWNDYEIWILFLEEKHDQPQKQAREQLFLTRFSEKINEVFWLTNHYLIFNTGGKTKIAEIDDRDRINIFDLGKFDESKIFWSQIAKSLYVLANKNLYASEKLAP